MVLSVIGKVNDSTSFIADACEYHTDDCFFYLKKISYVIYSVPYVANIIAFELFCYGFLTFMLFKHVKTF